jgi:hypothetical protein
MLLVCDPRKNALMRDGNQNDRADARNLAELLRTNQVKAVYHEKHGTRALKELGRSYLTLTKGSTRGMNRIKSVYRSWAIPCGGTSVYSRRHRAEWLAKLVQPGVRMRAEHLYEQLDSLEPLRQAARRELLRESQKHTRRSNCFARFLRSDRFAPPCWWSCCKHPIASVPSALRGSVHLRSKWTPSLCVHFARMTSYYTPVQTVGAVRLHRFLVPQTS